MASKEHFWYRFYHETVETIVGWCMVGAGISCMLIVAIILFRGVQFDRSVDTHFVEAMRSVRVEEASHHLSRGMEELRVRGLDRGTTSLFFPSPDDDIGLWYTRVNQANIELARVRDKTQSEQAVVLENVREALFIGGMVHEPSGISLHGYGTALFAWFCAAATAFLFAIGLISDPVQRWLREKSYEVPSGGMPA